MQNFKIILEPKYKDLNFRSESAARWYVFFEAYGVNFRYAPDGITTILGRDFPQTFTINDLKGRVNGTLCVGVYENMTQEDEKKILSFITQSSNIKLTQENIKFPFLIVSQFPSLGSLSVNNIDNTIRDMSSTNRSDKWDSGLQPFNFETIDGDFYTAYLGIKKKENLIYLEMII